MSTGNHIIEMFDQIAKTYDRCNRILSFGIDKSWRERLAQSLPSHNKIAVLDVATGTGDLLFAMLSARPNIEKAIGVDLAQEMLSIGQKKASAFALPKPIEFLCQDAAHLAFEDGTFDVVTIAFGIRNVLNIDKSLKEMHRVLKPSGTLLVLEFSLPENRLWRSLYLAYFRYVLPFIGGILSNNFSAYSYLNRSVEGFYSKEEFACLMQKAGFASVSLQSLSKGIAHIYSGSKE